MKRKSFSNELCKEVWEKKSKEKLFYLACSEERKRIKIAKARASRARKKKYQKKKKTELFVQKKKKEKNIY